MLLQKAPQLADHHLYSVVQHTGQSGQLYNICPRLHSGVDWFLCALKTPRAVYVKLKNEVYSPQFIATGKQTTSQSLGEFM